MSRHAIAVLALAAACEGSHEDLGVEETTAATTTGKTTGAGAGDGGSAGGLTIAEPDGPPKLTLVPGMPDQPLAAFCFLVFPPDPADPAEPFPQGAPLTYGEPITVAMPGAPIPEGVDVEVVIVGGDVPSAQGESCRALADDPSIAPSAIVQSLGVLPASALVAPRSLLLVTTGCLSPGHEDAAAPDVCGEAYEPDVPNPFVVVVPMSRYTDPSAVGIQIAQAISGPTDPLDVKILPGFTGSTERIVGSDVVFGEVAPFPPSKAFKAADISSVAAGTLRTYTDAIAMPLEQTPVADAFTAGGLVPSDLPNGTNVVFLAIGPAPGVGDGPWWSGFTFVALRSDP